MDGVPAPELEVHVLDRDLAGDSGIPIAFAVPLSFCRL